MKENTVLVIVGPTACGKSALAMDVAKKFNGVIINGDALQIYKDIPIISAAPSEQDKREVEHRLYEIYDCSKRGNVVEWADLCAEEIRKVWVDGRLPIVVGGSGMYIDSLVHGMTPIPEPTEDARIKVQKKLRKYGLWYLYRGLQRDDPEIAETLSPNDELRIVRAAEIIKSTGKKVSWWHSVPLIQKLPEANYTVIKINPSIEEIEKRCCLRLDKMVYEQGVLKEIEALLARNLDESLPAMKALGVPDLGLFVRGIFDLGESLTEAKLHTRQYAKRQKTWLRNKMPSDIEFTDIYNGQSAVLEKISALLK